MKSRIISFQPQQRNLKLWKLSLIGFADVFQSLFSQVLWWLSLQSQKEEEDEEEKKATLRKTSLIWRPWKLKKQKNVQGEEGGARRPFSSN